MDKNWSSLRKHTYVYFEKMLSSQADNAKLIDLGAGPQQFKKLTSRFDVTAVDKDNYEGIDVIADLNETLPFEDESVDIVLLSHTLEHIATPQYLTDECHRVLKKGGIVLAVIPFLVLEHQGPYDFYRYTQHGIEHLFKDFAKVEIEDLGTANDVLFEIAHKICMKSGVHRFIEPLFLLPLHLFPRVKDIKMAHGLAFTATK